MFSIGYDCHKVSLGCWSSQPAAIKATSPLSHEMTWQAAQRQHTTLNQWCSSSTPTKPQGKCWHNTNMCSSAEVHAECTVTETNQAEKKKKKKKWNYVIHKWSGSPLLFFLLLLLFPVFNFNGDRGDRWRELLTLLALSSTSPLPWCLYLNYISALASTVHSVYSQLHSYPFSLHLFGPHQGHMERKHPQNRRTRSTLHQHRPAHAHMLELSPEMVGERRRAMEMSEGWREEIKILARDSGRK